MTTDFTDDYDDDPEAFYMVLNPSYFDTSKAQPGATLELLGQKVEIVERVSDSSFKVRTVEDGIT